MILIVVSTGHFDALIQECERLKDRFNFSGQIGSSKVIPSFSHFLTCAPNELVEKMKEAECVITHAGTGMLSMLYKLQKKAIVIPKQIRYGEANDGQVELALKWGELGMGLVCLDVKDLEAKLNEAKTFIPFFPCFPKIGDTIRQNLNPSHVIPPLADSALT